MINLIIPLKLHPSILKFQNASVFPSLWQKNNFLLHGGKEHEISQAFAKAGTLWVCSEQEWDIERAMEGTLANWKCMSLLVSFWPMLAKLSPAWFFLAPQGGSLWFQQRFFCAEGTR